MLILIALFTINPSYATGTWPKYGATFENTHLQYMKGAIATTPIVKWSYKTGSAVESYGAIVDDMDNDGNMEVVIGSDDDKIYSFNGINGAVEWSYATGGDVWSSAATADADGDGNVEIVFGSCDGKVYSLKGANGTLEWSYVTGNPVWSSPVIADIDKDGNMEIVIGSKDNKVYSLNGIIGTVKWSYTTGSWVVSSPAIADMDGDAIVEIVVGSVDTKIYCLDGIAGGVEWSYKTGGAIYSSPAIVDADGDGTMEVVIGSRDFKVYTLDGPTGTLEWSYNVGTDIWSSPATDDMDKDGIVEILIGSWGNKIYSLNGKTGAVNWSYNAGGPVHRGISAADLDVDYTLEVLIPDFLNNILICVNGENGGFLWTKTLASDAHDAIPADIDNDGCVEIVVGTAVDQTVWALDDATNISGCGNISGIEENSESSAGLPQADHLPQDVDFKIIENKICLCTPNTINADIKLYDLCGRLKQLIYSGSLSKGTYTFTPNIKSSGIYFATLSIGQTKTTKKLILMK